MIIRFDDIMLSNYKGINPNISIDIRDEFVKFSQQSIVNNEALSNDIKIFSFYNKCYNTYADNIFSEERLILELKKNKMDDSIRIHDLSIKREEAIKSFDEMMLEYFILYLKPLIKDQSLIKNTKLAPIYFQRGIDNRIFEYYQENTFSIYLDYINELINDNDYKNPINTLKREENINKGISMFYERNLDVLLTFNDFNIYEYGHEFIEQYRFIHNKAIRKVLDDTIRGFSIIDDNSINIIKNKIDDIRDIMYFIYKNGYLGLKDKDTLINELECNIDFSDIISDIYDLINNPIKLRNSNISREYLLRYNKDFSLESFINDIAIYYINLYLEYNRRPLIKRLFLFRTDDVVLESRALDHINKLAKEKYMLSSDDLYNKTLEIVNKMKEKEENNKKILLKNSYILKYEKTTKI